METEPDSPQFRITHRQSVAVALAAVVLAWAVAIWPTLGSQFWLTHEEFSPVVRTWLLAELWSEEGLSLGGWLPQAVMGYGYPFFTFYAPFGFYVAAGLVWLGGASVDWGLRLSFYAAFLASGLLMFGFALTSARRIRLNGAAWWAMAAALLFLGHPYHLTDMYVRGSLAQCWGWAWFAGGMWGLELLRSRRGAAGFALAAGATALLVLSHNITALYGVALMTAWVLLLERRVRVIAACAAAIGCGIGLSAFFWLPALMLKGEVQVGNTVQMWATADSVRSHAVPLIQQWSCKYGWGSSVEGADDKFYVGLGWPTLLLVAYAVAGLVMRGLRSGWRRTWRGWAVLALLLAVVFAMSPQMPWEAVPSLFRYIQFPWRLLVFGAFLVAALMIEAAPGLRRIAAGLFVPVVLVGLGHLLWVMEKHPPYLVEEHIENLPQRAIMEEERNAAYLGTIVGEYLPRGVDLNSVATLVRPEHWLDMISGEAIVTEELRHGTSFEWRVEAIQDSTFRVRQFWFPDWHYYIDGERADDRLEKIDWGMMKLSVPAGTHDLALVRGISAPGRVGAGLSAFAFVLTASGIVLLRGARGRAWLKGQVQTGPVDPERGDA